MVQNRVKAAMGAMTFRRVAFIATALAFSVVVLGAYVRLSDAGLGCPDWPGCYGQIDVPADPQRMAQANAAYPERPVEVDKAWKEMIHRYLAGVLGLLILGLAVLAWYRRKDPEQPVVLPFVLLALVIFQALLGMWTVTLLLKPVVVMAHLLGGMTTLALLWWLALRQGKSFEGKPAAEHSLRYWTLLGLILVGVQVMLGGWTSANYAALACPDFPTCQAQWWPAMDFQEALVLWRGVGVSYEYGVLDNDARVAIHMMHRLGAVLVLAYLGWLSWWILSRIRHRLVRTATIAVAVLLMIQVSLGIANVVLHLPLTIAVAHNGVAALLILALVALNHVLRPREIA